MSDVFDRIAMNWKSPVVARREVGTFTGGAVSPKSLANHDSMGTGIAERYVVGRNVVYPVGALVDWLRAHTKTKQAQRGKGKL